MQIVGQEAPGSPQRAEQAERKEITIKQAELAAAELKAYKEFPLLKRIIMRRQIMIAGGDRNMRDFWRPIVREDTCLECNHRDRRTENQARLIATKPRG